MATATNSFMLLLTQVGLGVAEAPLFPAGGKLNVAWLSRQERGRGATIMDRGSPLGVGFGGLIITSLVVALNSWRLAFLVIGVGSATMGIIAYRYLRDRPDQHPSVNPAEVHYIHSSQREAALAGGAVPGGLHTKTAGRIQYTASRSFWGVILGRIGWATIFFGLLTWGPNYLMQARQLDLRAMGMATFSIFLAGAVGELVGGFLADPLQRAGLSRNLSLKSTLGFSSALACASIPVLPAIRNAGAAVALLVVTLFFLMWGGLYGVSPRCLRRRARRARSAGP